MDFISEFLKYSKNRGKINRTTLEIYRKDLEDFDGFIVDKDLLNINEKDILNFIEMLKLKYSDRSVYRKLTAIKSFYKYLVQNRIIENFPLREIELPTKIKKETLPLEKWEINRVLEVCDKENYAEKRDYIVIKLLYETGFKIGDILNLEIENLKTSDYRTIILNSDFKILTEKLSMELSEELKNFVEVDLKKMYTDRNKIFAELSRQNFRMRFINYGKKAGLRREIFPNMIKKTVFEEKIKGDNDLTLIERIREIYMKTQIGDE